MNPRAFLRLHLLLAVLLCLPLTAVAAPDTDTTFDRWFVLQMNGQRVGYAHITLQRQGDQLISDNAMQMTVRRGPVAITIEQGSRFVETAEGQPIEASSRTVMGQMAMHQHLRFGPDGITLTSRQADREQTQQLPPIEGEWLTPAAAQRYMEQQLDAGAETIHVRTLDASVGVTPIEMTLTVVGEENVEVFGKVVPALAWDAQVSVMPGMAVREYVDAEGRTLKTEMTMPGLGKVEMLAADEQLAKAEVDPPEMLATMFITPEGPITHPRQLRSAVYELTIRGEGDLPADGVAIPRTGYQRVVWGDRRTARVVVDLAQPVNPQSDLPDEEHLAASMMLDHEDPKVRALVAEALGPEGEALSEREQAQRLRAFVQRYVASKDLSVGLATASEVARTAQGDCTEHAVLLAAMLRAIDIPSRTATGLVYVDEFLGHTGIFGGHMWTQAWLAGTDDAGGRWVDLDATLPDTVFDAAHITLGVSAMSAANITNDFMAMAPLLGRLDIKVVTTANGKTEE